MNEKQEAKLVEILKWAKINGWTLYWALAHNEPLRVVRAIGPGHGEPGLCAFLEGLGKDDWQIEVGAKE